MEAADFTRLRPFLIHTTARANLPQLFADGRLMSTRKLFERSSARPTFSLEVRRLASADLQFAKGHAIVRDQRPLHEGHIEFTGGWDLRTLVARLNSLVFLWPATPLGPVPAGLRHAGRYLRQGEELGFIRIRSDIVALEASALFATVNSGSPRSVGGIKSRRGPDTFRSLSRFNDPPGAVVEVAFTDLLLPPEAEWSTTLSGDWQPWRLPT